LALFEEVESQLAEFFDDEALVKTTAPIAPAADASPGLTGSELSRRHPK
jgi:hypothetical protein